jgi:hypothetical protein
MYIYDAEDHWMTFSEPSLPFLAVIILPVCSRDQFAQPLPLSTGFLDRQHIYSRTYTVPLVVDSVVGLTGNYVNLVHILLLSRLAPLP